MMAKPLKTLELHYPMIQFLIIFKISNTNHRIRKKTVQNVETFASLYMGSPD